MGNFQGGKGGGFRGGSGGGRPSFQKKSWGGSKGGASDRPAEMFKATCSNCGNACEVPFRPSGDKPVYCNNCFGKMREGGDRAPRKDFGDRAPRREFNDRSARPAFPPKPAFDAKPAGNGMEKQLNEMNAKLDRLIRTLEVMSLSKPAPAKETKEKVVKSTLKTVVKKAVKKTIAKKKK
jgi:CxxC-x17-CxxC domain-containing protein